MLVRKTKKQKEYLLKLKNEVSGFIVNYKKRYQLFPWNEVNKVSKFQINSNSPIKVNGVDFTVKKLVKEINKTKTKIQSRLKPSYYNYILKAYIKDSINKDDKQIRIIFNQYKEELQNVFKEMQLDLMFCLEGLREMNKALKPEKRKITKNNIEVEESTMNRNIDTVIFDFGSVLVKNTSRDAVKNSGIPEEYVEELAYTYFKNAHGISETMSISELLKYYKSKLRPELKQYAEKGMKLFASSKEPFDYTEKLITGLKKKGYKIYYLSNWNKASFELCKKKGVFDFTKHFDGGVISYEVNETKPGRKIYEILINKYDLTPETCVFYDDKKENVDTANRVGISGIVFTKDTVKDIMSLPNLKGKKVLTEACKDLESARKFVHEVGKLAKKYGANYFIVTDGASGINNNGNPAVSNARKAQIEWEKKHKFDPNEDWSDQFKETENDIITEGTHKTGIFHKLYHVSLDNLDGKVLHPRIPDNRLTSRGLEEASTPRVCFAPTIDRCLMALSQNLQDKELYVHIPIDKTKYQDVSKHKVADAEVTKEKWVTCDVKLKCIGKIHVISAQDKEYKFDLRDVNKKAANDWEMNPIKWTYKWNWEWVDKYIKESTDDDNKDDLKLVCNKIVNDSYTFIRRFLSNPDIKTKFKKFYDSDDININDMEKDADDYSIDCGITQKASISSNIFSLLLTELNKYLHESYSEVMQKYNIKWNEKNSGYIWLSINSRSADKYLEE